MGFAFSAGIIIRLLAEAVYPADAIMSEIAESQAILAPWRLSSYTCRAMIVLCYGSNINPGHLNEFLDTHGVTLDTDLQGQHAILPDYRLRTNYFAGSHGAGACNIEPAPGHHVEGVLVSITKAIQAVLRIKEGFPLRYKESRIIVNTVSTGEPLRAITYMVTPEYRLDVDLPVAARYRDLILDGAEQFGFSKSYQQELRHLLRAADSMMPHACQNASL